MDGRVVGYEYGYRFWTGEKAISDEINSLYRYTASMGNNVFVFEVRTSFSAKSRIGEDETTIGSERFYAHVLDYEGESEVKRQTSFRLQEYWMPDEEIEILVREAFDFARQLVVVGSDFRVIPIVVEVNVCTVQQEGEDLEHAMDRAIWAEKMAQLCLWQAEYYTSKRNCDFYVGCHLRDRLPRIRVDDVDKGLGLMETCPVCLREPIIGTR